MTQEAEKPEILEITAGGKVYRLGRIGFFTMLGAEPEIRRERRAEFCALVKSLGDVGAELATRAVTSAFDHYVQNVAVSRFDVYDWLNTASGEVYAVACSLKFVTTGMTDDEARVAATELLGNASATDAILIKSFLSNVLTGA